MKARTLLTVVALLTTCLVGAAGGHAGSSLSALVKTAFNPKLNRAIVVDGRGRTLYMLTSDTGGVSVCYAKLDPRCLVWWRPLTSIGPPRAGAGIKASLLGTFTREDGKIQVRYNRHPLYYFHGGSGAGRGDTKPGDIEGQGFLQVWYVLSPRGTPIRTKVT
jgi:predicted lipoprotein with Yx(FWY)xxD motif